MNPLLWIMLLVVAGLALIILEVFIPSGGVLGLLSVLALGAGVVTAFVELGAASGLSVLAAMFVAVPVALAVAFRWFPATPLGRRVLPPAPEADDILPDVAERRRLRGLVGRSGRTMDELMPWGRVEIEGESLEAVSDGGPIAGGTPVEVTGVQGRSLVVRQLVRIAPPPPAELPAAAAPAESAARRSDLLEEFDFDEVRKNSDRTDQLDSPPSPNQA
jgi:membrane-bound ClpP family serine protease